MKTCIIFCLILLFIVIIFFLHYHSETVAFHKDFLPKDVCKNLIQVADKYEYETYNEPVDNRPVYEIDIFTDNRLQNPELWKIIEPHYLQKILPIVQKKYKNIVLDFVFLRRYNNLERKNLSIHTDDNLLSINILLSDPNDFTGGEFYIFDNAFTKKHFSLYENVLTMYEEEKEKFINSFETLPIMNMKQGDCIMYEGLKHFHGVLPVKTGQRYIVSFFFEEV
jgi:hypothetical protein